MHHENLFINQNVIIMKKALSICLLFVAFAFCAKAQVTVILEAHDVWEDGSGYQLLLDADHNTYGSTIPTSGPLTSSGDVDASVYAEFEYKIPENADGALSTSNIVLDGQVEITIPAGTYDFCVTNPTPGAKMWIAGGDNGRKDDYVFNDGWTYHFTVAREGTGDAVTIEVIPNEAAVMVNPTSLDFGSTITNQTSTLSLTVSGYNLSNNITANVTGEAFTISSNGTSFATTATLPTAGGTLYVQFAPLTAATSTGVITLTSGDATATVNLSGEGIECSVITTFPYTCTFDPNAAETACWQTIDANGDGDDDSHNGQMWFNGGFSSDNDGVAQYFYNQTSAADDWLISPEFVGMNLTASFDYMIASATYPETFGVYVIPQGGTYANAVEVVAPQTVENDGEWVNQTVDLSAYDNQTIRLAIHVTSEADHWYIVFDNFTIEGDVNIDENTMNTVSIFPNPATTVLNVVAEGYNTIEIVNLLGQTVYTANATSNMQINVSNLNNGVYFVRLTGANGIATQKFIKK